MCVQTTSVNVTDTFFSAYKTHTVIFLDTNFFAVDTLSCHRFCNIQKVAHEMWENSNSLRCQIETE